MINEQTKGLIASIATEYRLDPMLIQALIMTESAGNQYAIRFEPFYQYLFDVTGFASANHITRETEETLQRCSLGMGQLMGGLLRELGHKTSLIECFEPSINIRYMSQHLRNLSDRYQYEDKVIVSYNAGSPIKTKAGTWINERYLDKVSKQLRELRRI